MVFSNNLLMGAAGQATGYEIEQSIRFNDDDSAFMDRTPSSASNRKTWTWSGWVKRASNSEQAFFAAGDNSSNRFGLRFSSAANGAYLGVFDDISAATSLDLQSEKNFVDFSAWYHIVVAVDTTQSTASNRCKVYVNGNQITDFNNADYMGQNTDTSVNNTVKHRIGRLSYNTAQQFDGYLAEINFVDGSQLAPANFGETSNTTGQWVPIKYAGSYGTNGFYIKGEDSSDLGNDSSGNNNDFTTSGLAAADQMLDSPTDNFTTFNPIGSCNVSGQALTLSDGNLRSSAGGTSNAIEAIGTIAPTTGKYYAEFTLNAAPQLSNQYPAIGIIGIDLNITGGNNLNSSTFFGYLPSGNKLSGGSSSSYGDTYGNGDIIGIALDLDNQKIYFSKNGTYQNSGDPAAGSNAAFTSLVAGTEYRFCVSHAGSSATDVTMNAGQSAFNTAAPTGFSPMSTANLPDSAVSDPADQFDIGLWAGNNTDGRAITGYNFGPDWVWIKARNNDYSHNWTDAVRGAGQFIQSNTTDAQVAGPGAFGSTLAFTSDGFTLDNGTSSNLFVNQTGTNYVGWAWNANGSGSSNGDGSITSTVSANATSGFSIIRWTGTASNGTIGHGLGVQPTLYILKNTATTNSWIIGSTLYAATAYLSINNTDALATGDAAVFNSTHATSSVINLGTNVGTNGSSGSNNMICYAFANVEGFSKIGTYEGNGSSSDGPFVYTGFKPRWIMFRRYDAGDGWSILDTARGSGNFGSAAGSTGKDPTAGNEMNNKINANDHFGEEDNSGGSRKCSFLSNGFKVKNTNTAMNASGGDYLYMAFAESPFETATAR